MHLRRVIVSGMIGNGLEWYDYALYGSLAPILASLFFPNENHYVSMIQTYGVFAAGFLMRPLGAMLFGYIGDRFGRKVSLAAAILLMAIPTACIGLIPAYAEIGILAPIALMIIRLLQGLSLGGEFSGSIAFLVEHAPPKRRGLVGSCVLMSMSGGILLGSGIATLMTHLQTAEEFAQWGWRIPFLLSVPIGLIGFYIRACTHESPCYIEAKANGTLSASPLRESFRNHLPEMMQAVGVYFAVTVPFYTLVTFMIGYMSEILGHTRPEALFANTLVMILMTILMPVAAHLSDKVGRKKVMVWAAIGYVLFTYPIFHYLVQADFMGAVIAQLLFTIVLSFYVSPVPALLVELFPTPVRATGMAVAYNLVAALFGGTAPLVCTWLIKTTGMKEVIAFYIMACACISLVALYFYRDRHREALR